MSNPIVGIQYILDNCFNGNKSLSDIVFSFGILGIG